jgi:exopolysaccharide/PEP-CTERM locus tyrosine autokinase
MTSLIEQAAARLAQLRNAGQAPQPPRVPGAAEPEGRADPAPLPGDALPPADFYARDFPSELPPLPEELAPDLGAGFPPVEFPPAYPNGPGMGFETDLPSKLQPELPAAFQPEPLPLPTGFGPEPQPELPPPLSSVFPYEAPQQGAGGAFDAGAFGARPAARSMPVPSSRPGPSTSRRVELDLQRLAAANFVTPGAPRTRIADQYRVIKRPLIANALGKGAAPVAHGNRIMVTSALPGEGKTFTAVNLALSIAAELDTTVMLVDADVGRPSVLKTLGLAPGPGLLDVLEGRATMPEVLLRTNVDKLTLLSAGTLHDRATEVLASDGMHTLLQEVAQRYDDRIIIFDSPPLLLTTEARALASHMGQVIMVVRAGHTSQSDVQTALSYIDFCPVKLLLLNQARSTKFDSYATSYKYGYGYAREQDEQHPA